MAVAVHFDPKLASPLAVYMAIVARLAQEVPGQAWLRYDKFFRQAVAVNLALPWDHREPDVWLAATAEQPRLAGGTQLCQSRAQPSPTGWAGVCRGNLQEVHLWGVSFPSSLQVPPCLYVVQVPWASCHGLLHVAAPSKEAGAI